MPELKRQCLSVKWDTLTLTNIINELDFLNKIVIIQWNVWNKKRLTIALTQSNRTVPIFYNKEKHKISEITYQPKTFKNTNIVDIKSVITVHSKTSDKLCKTIKQAEKVIALYIAIQRSIVRYVNPANHHPARITKADKDFDTTLDLKYINFPVKIRDIHKVEFHRHYRFWL